MHEVPGLLSTSQQNPHNAFYALSLLIPVMKQLHRNIHTLLSNHHKRYRYLSSASQFQVSMLLLKALVYLVSFFTLLPSSCDFLQDWVISRQVSRLAPAAIGLIPAFYAFELTYTPHVQTAIVIHHSAAITSFMIDAVGLLGDQSGDKPFFTAFGVFIFQVNTPACVLMCGMALSKLMTPTARKARLLQAMHLYGWMIVVFGFGAVAAWVYDARYDMSSHCLSIIVMMITMSCAASADAVVRIGRQARRTWKEAREVGELSVHAQP